MVFTASNNSDIVCCACDFQCVKKEASHAVQWFAPNMVSLTSSGCNAPHHDTCTQIQYAFVSLGYNVNTHVYLTELLLLDWTPDSLQTNPPSMPFFQYFRSLSSVCAHTFTWSEIFTYAAPYVWNSLPFQIRSSNTLTSFKFEISLLLVVLLTLCVCVDCILCFVMDCILQFGEIVHRRVHYHHHVQMDVNKNKIYDVKQQTKNVLLTFWFALPLINIVRHVHVLSTSKGISDWKTSPKHNKHQSPMVATWHASKWRVHKLLNHLL